MHRKRIILSFLIVLSSCSYGNTKQEAIYDNTFTPWPSGVDYTTIVDCGNSFFRCSFDKKYEYYLSYRDGTIIEFSGDYEYSNESFVLDNEGTIIILKKHNYFQFYETIVYKEKEYTIIWHAQHIFD